MKNQNGITLITLTLTIAIMIILTFTITVNIEPYINQKTKTNFETDMSRLKEEISQYYARVKDIPTINRFTNITMLEGIKNVNDDDEYYVIDIKQLEVKLNYGADYYTISKKDESEEITDLFDVYIINKQSHTIYYPKGVKYNGTVHYRLPEVYSKIEEKITAIYYIDTDNIQTQMLKKGQSALDISFTPTKDDYIFIGWREDTSAEGDVLTQKTMQNKEITLYAVFGKEVSVSYDANGGDSTPATQIDYIYYNNGNEVNPTFTLAAEISRSGYAFQSWNLGSTDGAAYDASSSVSLSSSTMFYAQWKVSYTQVTGAISSGSTQITNGDGYTLFPSWGYSTSGLDSTTIINWNRVGEVIAKAPCSVSVSGRIVGKQVDGITAYVSIYLFKNDSLYSTWIDTTTSDYYDAILSTKTLTLQAGERCSIRVWGGNNSNSNARTRYDVHSPIYFVATPL